jgi:hypothetical protein
MQLPTLSVPKFTTKLSTGETVQYRPYLVKEEKVILLALQSDKISDQLDSLCDLVKVCTFEKVDVDKLSVVDLLTLIAKIRARSAGESAKFLVECKNEKCDETEIEVTYDVSSFTAPKSKNKSNRIMLVDDSGITLKHPTAKDQIALENKYTDIGDTYDLLIELLAMHIDTIFTKDESFNSKELSKSDLLEFVGQFTKEQAEQVQSWIENEPALRADVEYTCPKCGEKGSITISGLDDFFV